MSNPGWLIVCSKCGQGEVPGYWLVEDEEWDGKTMGVATVKHYCTTDWVEECPTSPSPGQPDQAPTA